LECEALNLIKVEQGVIGLTSGRFVATSKCPLILQL
jgi:hypothetical protein